MNLQAKVEHPVKVRVRFRNHFPAGVFIETEHELVSLNDPVQLIPDEIKGFEVDHILIKAENQMVGAPHMKGTLEYFYCLKGKIEIKVDLDYSMLEQGDLLIFSGDQKHTYTNYSSVQSEGISFIVLPQRWGVKD